MKSLPTSEVVSLIGVHAITLERWLAKNPKLAPKTLRIGGRVVRLWTMKDVSKLKRFKAAQRKGRKPKAIRKR
jgi:predicted DNA-binding transcriptional regulator AlpA